MQDDPRYDDVVADVAALPRGAARASPSLPGIPEERDLPRSRDRLRQDGRAELRAPAPARRARRDRPADPRRHLAQELARPDPGRPGREDRHDRRERRRRRRRLRARRDDLPRPRRPRARRGADGCPRGGHMSVLVELHGLEIAGRHGVEEEERRTAPAVPLRRRARGAGRRGSQTGSRTPSTTARSSRVVRELSDGAAVSAARGDGGRGGRGIARAIRGRVGARARSQAGRPAWGAGRVDRGYRRATETLSEYAASPTPFPRNAST